MKELLTRWLGPFLIVLWIFGIHVNDLARFFATLLLLVFWTSYRKGKLEENGQSHRLQNIVYAFFLVSMALFLFTEPFFSVFTGSHGIDFAIFSQIVHNIFHQAWPLSSLISMQKLSFFTHHLAFYFYLPALLMHLGLSSYTSLALLHLVSGVLAGLGFYMINRKLGFRPALALAVTALLFANPTVRHGLFYGVHDEIYALPMLLFAYWGWLSQRIGLTVVLLLLAATTKESVATVGVGIALMCLIDKFPLSKRQQIQLILTAILLSFVFIFYVFLQPQLMGKEFDHISKIASLSQLMEPSMLLGKAQLLLVLLLPLLFFPLFVWREWHLFLPAIPLLGMIMISNFEQMWVPFNYYGVVPSFLLYTGAVIALSRYPSYLKISCTPTVIALLFAIAFSMSGKKPIRTIYDFITLPSNPREELKDIPRASTVIASPAAALFMLDARDLWRLKHAADQPPQQFDYIVRQVEDNEELGPLLSSRAKLCARTARWEIYCKSPGDHSL